jgi:hypothetical protein
MAFGDTRRHEGETPAANEVCLTPTTPGEGGLTDGDRAMAETIDGIG